MVRRVSLLSLAMLMPLGFAHAQSPPGEEALAIPEAVKEAMAKEAGKGKDKDKDKSPFPKFEKVTKGMKSQKGLFTLWSYPPSAKDKDREKLLCQVPAGFLGEKFMLSISFSGGGFFTGFPLEEHVVQWEVLDRQLLLIEPETHFVVKKGAPISDVVKRTYPERIRAAIPIVTKTPSGDPVIDLGRLLKSNFADIAWMSRGGMFGMRGGGGAVNSTLSKWTKKKVFELNMEIGVELALGRGSPPGSFDKKMVHFSFWKLPKSDYSPRIADDRVGYFLTANQDWTKPVDSRDLFNRYVDRWHLVKRDSSLAICEPKQPIVFYIEKTVPVKYRRAVRDGILEWNKAYEKIGFANAVQVRQQTHDNEWKDLDPEDMRYSFFRWIVTGAGFAMGPHRANPFTGQIYDADIIFDDSMVRYFEQSAARNISSMAMAMKMNDPAMHAFLDKFPQWKRPTRDWQTFSFGQREEKGVRQALRARMRHRGHIACDYAEGMKHQMAVAHAMLAGASKEVKEQFLYDVIKQVVMHEVGHTLGLRHNFKASTIYTLDEIREKRGTGEALVGSVMDYNPVLFMKDQPLEGHFLTPTIGPYDFWAIEYGYRPADGSYKPKEEETPEGDDEDGDGAVATDDDDSAEGTPEISEELLAKLPPEVREMLKSDEAAKMMKAARKKGGKGKGNGDAFKKPASGEEGMLKAIASRAAEPLLIYATDEDTTGFSPDPRSNRFDMGADPMDWAKMRMELINKRLENVLDWAVKDEESWYHLRSVFVSMMFEKAVVLDYVGRYIGGQYSSRSHRGDPDEQVPFEMIDAKRQREAMDFIEEHVFNDDFFAVPTEVLNHLTVPRWWHAGASINYAGDFPYYSLVAAMQWYNLVDRLFPNTLRRMHDAEVKTDARDRFTVAEYLQRLQKACWGDSLKQGRGGKGRHSDAKPMISSVRRSLQREYLNLMEPLVRIAPGRVISPDIHAMLQHSLRKLNERIAKVVKSGDLDFASEAHLASCRSRIERMLVPELDEWGM